MVRPSSLLGRGARPPTPCATRGCPGQPPAPCPCPDTAPDAGGSESGCAFVSVSVFVFVSLMVVLMLALACREVRADAVILSRFACSARKLPEKSESFFRAGIYLISFGSPHVRPRGVHRTCGEPNLIESAPHWGGIERPVTRTLPVAELAREAGFDPVDLELGRVVLVFVSLQKRQEKAGKKDRNGGKTIHGERSSRFRLAQPRKKTEKGGKITLGRWSMRFRLAQPGKWTEKGGKITFGRWSMRFSLGSSHVFQGPAPRGARVVGLTKLRGRTAQTPLPVLLLTRALSASNTTTNTPTRHRR